MFAHVLYCLEEIEAELEGLTPATSDVAADLTSHLAAMRRLIALAAETTPAGAGVASGEELAAEEDIILEVEDDLAAGIDEVEPAESEDASLEVEDGFVAEIETEEPAIADAAVMEAVDKLIAEASTDDLSLIRGIDAELAGQLAGQGITRFATIASWTAADIASLSPFASHERIAKENWIEQAALLAAGTMTSFAAEALTTGDVETTPEVEAAETSAEAAAGAAGEPAEPTSNVISLETHRRLADGLVSRLPAKVAPAPAAPDATAKVLPFDAKDRANADSLNRWMIRIAASLILVACAGALSLQSATTSPTLTWVIGAL